MNRFAQKRSVFDELSEKLNPVNWGAAFHEKLDKQFKALMETLRYTDDKIRRMASGDDGEVSLKDLLSDTAKEKSGRRYISALAILGMFHERMENIVLELVKIKDLTDEEHKLFMLSQVDDKAKEKIKKLKERFASYQVYKEAGIVDWIGRVKRDWGLKSWERRYPKQTKFMVEGLSSLFDESKELYSSLLTSLKGMSKARASRSIEEYSSYALNFVNKYRTYDRNFRKFYNDSNIKDILNRAELESEKEEKKTTLEEAVKDVGKDKLLQEKSLQKNEVIVNTLNKIKSLKEEEVDIRKLIERDKRNLDNPVVAKSLERLKMIDKEIKDLSSLVPQESVEKILQLFPTAAPESSPPSTEIRAPSFGNTLPSGKPSPSVSKPSINDLNKQLEKLPPSSLSGAPTEKKSSMSYFISKYSQDKKIDEDDLFEVVPRKDQQHTLLTGEDKFRAPDWLPAPAQDLVTDKFIEEDNDDFVKPQQYLPRVYYTPGGTPTTIIEKAKLPTSGPKLDVNVFEDDLPLSQLETERDSLKRSHKHFLHTLESLSGYSAKVVRSFISKYASEIAEEDPYTSVKLLSIAARM